MSAFFLSIVEARLEEIIAKATHSCIVPIFCNISSTIVDN